MKARTRNLLIHAFAASAVLSLAACGGDGDDPPAAPPDPAPAPAPNPGPGPAPAPAPAPAPSPDPDPTPPPPDPVPPPPAPPPGPPGPPTPVTLFGQVTRNAALQNATVCLDLNDNGACDAGEPASAATGVNGQYSLTTMPADAAAARLIAVVKANVTIDANKPGQPVTTGSDYVMTRPKGSAGGINPLTTLVQAGVAAGMTESTARSNVASQLGIAAGKIDNYQGDPPASDDNVQDTARWIAAFTSVALREGIPLAVHNPAVAGAAYELMDNLIWFNASNYYSRSLQIAARPAGTVAATATDERARKNGGAAQPDFGSATSLYRAAYLTPTGWQMCGRNTPTPVITTTGGNPSRSVYCGTSVAITINQSTPVTGTLADLVSNWQGRGALNRINNDGTSTANLLGALGSAALPAGAEETHRRALTLSSDIVITDTWTRAITQADGRDTLSGVVAHYAVASVDTSTGTNAGNTTLSMGLGSTDMKTMRVAFGAGNAAHYYECDLATPGGNFANPPNCQTTTTGTYSIVTVNGAQIMRFAGHPAVDASIGYDVVYTQIDWGGGPPNRWVYRAHATKPDYQNRFAQSLRLNGAAWSAFKTQLGL